MLFFFKRVFGCHGEAMLIQLVASIVEYPQGGVGIDTTVKGLVSWPGILPVIGGHTSIHGLVLLLTRELSEIFHVVLVGGGAVLV